MDHIPSPAKKHFHIGICDDEPLAISYIQDILKKWADKNASILHISTFSSAEQFIFESDQSLDILFLDIQMGEMNGIDLAKKIRQHNETLHIIFVTAISDYISEGYDVSALHYLIKPVREEKLFEIMDRAIQNIEKKESFVILNVDQTVHKIPINSILYAEAFSHNLVITTQTSTLELRENISSLAAKLGISFVFPHRSYLVNLRYIKNIKKNEILLDNGITIPLSRYKYREINQAFIEYYKGKLTDGTF